eukprot:TRINITY_DN46196_c0_g2_i1.p1 TRINITY_DN46196_c0_g2~~TRINITY_DN46196_c0_g2_i1.p1  ORF type:complete len:254 (+),score=42.95 TRINITY_DN46196_c0_g2_i1:82-762(+)
MMEDPVRETSCTPSVDDACIGPDVPHFEVRAVQVSTDVQTDFEVMLKSDVDILTKNMSDKIVSCDDAGCQTTSTGNVVPLDYVQSMVQDLVQDNVADLVPSSEVKKLIIPYEDKIRILIQERDKYMDMLSSLTASYDTLLSKFEAENSGVRIASSPRVSWADSSPLGGDEFVCSAAHDSSADSSEDAEMVCDAAFSAAMDESHPVHKRNRKFHQRKLHRRSKVRAS